MILFSPTARLEEIVEHGKPVSMRTALHKSKKVYDRKRLKKAGINSDITAFVVYGSKEEARKKKPRTCFETET